MRSFHGPLTLMVMLLLSACGGGGGGGGGSENGGNTNEPSSEIYAPLSVDDRWVYGQGSSPDSGIEEQIVRISGTATLNGVTVALADTRKPADFSLIDRHYLRATSTLLEEHYPPTTPLFEQGISSVPLLHFPLASGNSFVAYEWQGLDINGDYDNDGVNETFDEKRIVTVIDKEALTTPLGEFPAAWKVTSLRTSRVHFSQGGTTNVSERVDEWLANKIGVVRRVITLTYTYDWGGSYTSQKSYDLLRYKVGGNRSEQQAPQVQEAILSPALGSTINDPWIKVRVPFDETIDVSALTEGSLVVTNAIGKPMPGTLSFTDRELMFRPTTPLQDGIYTVHANGISDAIGNLLDKYEWTFTVDTSAGSDPQNLVPLAVGNRWIYDITDQENTSEVIKSQRMETVTGSTTVQGRQGMVVQVRDILTNELSHELYLEKNASGLSQLFAPGAAPYQLNVAAIPLLHFPIYADTYENGHWSGLNTGRDYDGDGITDTMAVTLTTTIGNYPEYISVPAGAWSTAVRATAVQRIVITGSAAGGQAEIHYTTIEWLVPNIGAVKRVSETSTTGYNRMITQSLSAYRVGTLRSESIPPRLTTRTPSPSGVNVAPTEILLRFSEIVDIHALPSPALTVTNSAGQHVQGTLQTSNTQLRFVPANPLPDGRYHVTVANVTDLLGNALTGLSWDFTVDTIRPRVLLSSLTSGATNVATGTVITLTMSEPVPVGYFNSPLITLTTSDGASAYYSPQMNGNTLTITPETLQHGTTYTLTLTTSIADAYGNSLASPYSVTFTTPPAILQAPALALHNIYSSISAIAIGDVDDDGRNDLVIASGSSTILSERDSFTLHIFLQNADGTLAPPLQTKSFDFAGYGLVCTPSGIGIDDITGDGKTDILVGEAGCGFKVFERMPDGSWPRPIPIATINTFRMQYLDMNSDGLKDVVGFNGSLTNQMSVWHRHAGGGLGVEMTYEVPSSYGTVEHVHDMNGDGRGDLVVRATMGPLFGIMTQTNDGSFNAPIYYNGGSANHYWTTKVADLNNDGRTDLVGIVQHSTLGKRLAVMYQNTDGTLQSPTYYATGLYTNSLFISELNNDGRNDIITNTSSTLGLYLQDSFGMLREEDRYVGRDIIAVGDLNGDSKNDVVTVDGRTISIHWNVAP